MYWRFNWCIGLLRFNWCIGVQGARCCFRQDRLLLILLRSSTEIVFVEEDCCDSTGVLACKVQGVAVCLCCSQGVAFDRMDLC